MPHTCRSRYPPGSAQWGGKRPSRAVQTQEFRAATTALLSLKRCLESTTAKGLPKDPEEDLKKIFRPVNMAEMRLPPSRNSVTITAITCRTTTAAIP